MSAAPKHFVPSNPGGKPGKWRGKGLVEFIGRHTRDGVAMAEKQLRIMNGHEKGATVSHIQKAIDWLADRYMGKAVDIALSGDIDSPNNPLAELDADQLRALIHKIVPRRSNSKPPDASPPAESAQHDAPQQPQVVEAERIGAPTSPQPPETT